MTDGYSLTPVEDDDAWDALVRESPQGSLFATSLFLKTLPDGFERRWVLKGTKRVGGVYFDKGERESEAGQRALIYSGLLFGRAVSAEGASNRTKRFRITELFIEWLETYDAVQIRLSPHVEDIRPFSWHAYHSEDPSEKYALRPEYTSYLSLAPFARGVSDEAVSQMVRSRRRLWRDGKDIGRTEVETRLDLLTRGYSELMESQGQPVTEETSQALGAQLGALIEGGVGAQYITYEDDRPVYTTVFAWDNERAYGLYSAPVGDEPTAWQGTVCYLHTFADLAARGLKEVDFEGVNSPTRGWFKLGFGGDLRQLFLVTRTRRPL